MALPKSINWMLVSLRIFRFRVRCEARDFVSDPARLVQRSGERQTLPGITTDALSSRRMFSGFRSVWMRFESCTSESREMVVSQKPGAGDTKGLTFDAGEQLLRKALHVAERKRLVAVVLEEVEDGCREERGDQARVPEKVERVQ